MNKAHERLLEEIGKIGIEQSRLEHLKNQMVAKIKENSSKNVVLFHKYLGEILSRARFDMGYTLDEVVEISGITIARSSLSAVEHSRLQPSFYDVYSLVKVYDIDLEDVVKRIDDKMSEEKNTA